MIRRMLALSPVVFASLIAAAPVRADDVKLPPTMAMTAYDTGTAGFNITVGVGKMLKDKYGTDLRVLPAGNDVARLAPLRAKRAVASAMGSGSYFAQEGVFEFGAKEWDRRRSSSSSRRSTAIAARSALPQMPASRK
jgi:hypothetical protein